MVTRARALASAGVSMYGKLVSQFENAGLTKANFVIFTKSYAKHKIPLKDDSQAVGFLEALRVCQENREEVLASVDGLIALVNKSTDANLLHDIILFTTLLVTPDPLIKEDLLDIARFQNYLIDRIDGYLGVTRPKDEESGEEPPGDDEGEEPPEAIKLAREFKALYAEFKAIPNARIAALYEKLKCIYPFVKDTRKCRNKQMAFLIIAHYLTIDKLGSGAGGGIVTGASVGGVSVSITPTLIAANATHWGSFFSSTKYGLEFLAIRSSIGSARLIN